MSDWQNHPDFRKWERQINRDTSPKIAESEFTVTLLTSSKPDVKLAVELGLSILYDKPILLVVTPGTKVPAHLVRVADEIVEADTRDPKGRERINEAVQRMLGKRS